MGSFPIQLMTMSAFSKSLIILRLASLPILACEMAILCRAHMAGLGTLSGIPRLADGKIDVAGGESEVGK
jgi:hypothetical protein